MKLYQKILIGVAVLLGFVFIGQATGSPLLGGRRSTITSVDNATTTNSWYVGGDLSVAGEQRIQNWTMATSTIVCANNCEYTSIQSALNDGRTNIKLKAETYSEQVEIKDDNEPVAKVKIVGAGTDTVIQCNGSTQTPCVSATNTSQFIMQDLKILESVGATEGVGLDASDCPNCYYSNIRISGFATGTVMTDVNSTSFYSSFKDMNWFDNTSCLEISGSLANNNTFINSRCRPKAGEEGTGYYISNARGNSFYNANAEPSAAAGITGVHILGTSRENVFYNPWIEGNAVGVLIDSGATRNSFFGGSFTSNTSDYTDNGTDTNFIGINDTGTLLQRMAGTTFPGTQSTTTITNALQLGSTSGSNMLLASAARSYGSSSLLAGDGLANITNTSNNDVGFQVYSNNDGDQFDPLVVFRADNTSFDEGVLYLLQDGTDGGAYNIRMDGPAPQIEFVETDQSTPAGKFEMNVNGDIFRIASRNVGDSSFEDAFKFHRLANGGELEILGTDYSTFNGGFIANASSTMTSNFNVNGAFGVGTTSPDVIVEIEDTSEQLRLAYDWDSYCSFTTNADGDIAIAPTGTVGNATTTISSGIDMTNAVATSTLYSSSSGSGIGANIILEDTDGAGCTQIWVLDGTVFGETITCP